MCVYVCFSLSYSVSGGLGWKAPCFERERPSTLVWVSAMPYEKLKWRPLRSRKRTCCSAGQSTIARYIILGTSEMHHYSVCKLIRDRQSMSCRWKHSPYSKSLLTKWATPTSLSCRYDAETLKAMSKDPTEVPARLGLESQVTCYVIESDTSYNLLSGRTILDPWKYGGSLYTPPMF